MVDECQGADSRQRSRAGYLYVAVLFTTLLVSSVGLVALTSASLRMKSAVDQRDFLTAQALANSAVEVGIQELQSRDNWRSQLVNDFEYPEDGISLGEGSITWKLLDDDSNLADDDSDGVRLIGIGRVGSVVAAESVRLLPSGEALSCLESAFHCGGAISINGVGLRYTTQQHISSNANISVNGLLSSIDGSVQAVGTATGTINGEKVEGASARRMPGSSAFDYYLDNGTWIELSDIPVVDGRKQIRNCVISRQINPYGQTNPEAIYIIDCQGEELRVADCRINATLVLLRPSSASSIYGALRWDAAISNYPVLLVDGNIRMELSPSDLSESSTNVNFNPSGVPYLGITDSDKQDTYPSEINGLVYVNGTMNAVNDGKDSVFRGVVVCSAITAASSCHFTYREQLHEFPPPGFSRGQPMQVSPGSRRQETLQP